MQKKEVKKQIITLAKKYNISSRVLMELLISKGIDVKSEKTLITHKNFIEIRLDVIKKQEELQKKEKEANGLTVTVLKRKGKSIIFDLPRTKETKKENLIQENGSIKQTTSETTEQLDGDLGKQALTNNSKNKISENPEVLPAEYLDPPEKRATSLNKELFLKNQSDNDIKKEDTSSNIGKEIKKSNIINKPIFNESVVSTLKVKVDKKQDHVLLDRIKKHQEQKKNALLERNARKNQGYSGNFGRSAFGNKEKIGSTFPNQDVYAQRAQDVGVVASSLTSNQRGVTGGPNKYLNNSGKTTAGAKGRYKKKDTESSSGSFVDNKSKMGRFLANPTKIGKKVYKKIKKENVDNTEERKIIEVVEFISIAELAGLLGINSNMVIAKCLEMGMMVTINQRLDMDTILIIADDFNVDVKSVDEYQEELKEEEIQDSEESLVPRAPIVTVMGHVDHGKTSVLDYIRKSKVTQGEVGGITQHIGAYCVETSAGKVTFLDTPGHEAFAAMRFRGAQVTDLIVLVIAADSLVMPQTKEAIEHAHSAKVKLLVAINKCDLETANPDMVKAKLAEEGVLVDSYGGDVSCVEISAKRGDNMDKLLEMIALEAEVMELKANPNREFARATVIETHVDKGKGIVSTMIVQNGTLKIGNIFVCGAYSGKIRAIFNDKGKNIKEALPAMPVQILGFSGAPQSGDIFMVVASEQKARELASLRIQALRERERRQTQRITLEQLHEEIAKGEFHEFKLIVKADVDGSVEAIANSLDKLSTDVVRINIISKGIGAVKEADIHLASASNAMIISFHLLPTEKIRSIAEKSGVTIQYYNTIYQVTESIEGAMEGMLNPELVEEVCGEATILQIFKVPKIGIIAGSIVSSGYVDRASLVRLYREGVQLGEAKVTSLKRMKEDVKSVKKGLECGIGIAGVSNMQEGDTLAFFKQKEVARQLKPKK